jgi:hypothetical protein
MDAAVIDLLSLSPHVQVLSPSNLREAVTTRLAAAVDLHLAADEPSTRQSTG